MKVTLTEKVNEASKEKDEKHRDWANKDTREKKVAKAVLVPLIVSHDGAVHKDSVRRWKNFAPDIKVDWVRMAQNVLRFNVVIVGKFSTGAAGSRMHGGRRTYANLMSCRQPTGEKCHGRGEKGTGVLTMSALCVCDLQACPFPMAFC